MVFQQGCFGHLRRRLRGFALRRPQQAAEKDWFAILVAAGAFSGMIRWKWDIVPVVLCAGLARGSFQDVAPTVGPLGESCQCQLSVISRKASE
jgi:hypothetical protein